MWSQHHVSPGPSLTPMLGGWGPTIISNPAIEMDLPLNKKTGEGNHVLMHNKLVYLREDETVSLH